MERRTFIQSAGLAGVALLVGCGSGGSSGIPGSPTGSTLNTSGTTATLVVDFNAPVVAQKSVLPANTTALLLRGYNAKGDVVYGPVEVPVPPDEVLTVTVPVTMTTFEIAGLASAPV